MEKKFRFSIDRGGTFTDIYAEIVTAGQITYQVLKLLSVDPTNYKDAPREGIRRILESSLGRTIPKEKVETSHIEWIRMGTTVATNALLERQGEKIAFVTTKGFKDVLEIGNQARPNIFDLAIHKPELLYQEVVEIDERVRVINQQNTPSEQQDSAVGVEGTTGEKIEILKAPDEQEVCRILQNVYNRGIRSIAVALLHSFTFKDHEELIGRIAQQIGFTQVSLSSSLQPMVRLVPRGQTCCVDAYLTPLIKKYVEGFISDFDDGINQVNISFMMSDGGLCPVANFSGYRSILSGPAGGVVGYAMTTFNEKTNQPIIGFDMGGTSTDVSRFSGMYEHVFDTQVAGITIQAPQLDINTIAAGGGSRLFFRSGLFVVGPESSGAHPGPVCYRKGGYLSVTDANLFLGKLVPELFPKIFGPTENEPLDADATAKQFEILTKEVNDYYTSFEPDHPKMLVDEVAHGFIKVANEAMCRPIRSLTEAKGYNASEHILACFGGAGAQHACSIARSLGMRKVFIHRFAGILSAYGMGLADVVYEKQVPCATTYSKDALQHLNQQIEDLSGQCSEYLIKQGFSKDQLSFEIYLNLRYEGTDTSMMVLKPNDENYQQSFTDEYKREYGFTIEDRPIIVDDIRVRAVGKSAKISIQEISKKEMPAPVTYSNCYFEDLGRHQTPVFLLTDFGSDTEIEGPCIVVDKTNTIIIENDCKALINSQGNIEITIGKSEPKPISTELDLIQLSVFSHRFMSIAEQMGKTLQRTSISTNIKERLDFSCALFGPDGGLVANAPHLPVHLGAMQEAVRWQIQHLGPDWKEGEVILSNHPDAGGSHLPDMTVITPVFSHGKAVFYVASRGHHADIGGITPGSMPPFSRSLEEEGCAIKSFKLVRDGTFQSQGVSDLLMAPATIPRRSYEAPISGSRNLKDNISDLKAQVAANNKGIQLVNELIAYYGLNVVQAYMYHVQTNAEQAVRDMLRSIATAHKLDQVGQLKATDYMDDGSVLDLTITINKTEGTANFDFSGTGYEICGNVNAPRAVTMSAIIYCLRCLVKENIPLNQGCLNPIKVNIPRGTFLHPSENAAVVGGNVLTSQRVTDVILQAFAACACSQGCMNNLTFGNEHFGYYETIAGGAGAGPSWHGASATQVHMTNTRITDAEILERRYPVLLRQFSIRRGSGGKGSFQGGDGVVREIEFLQDNFSIGILSERRTFAPRGMKGGEDGARGLNLLLKLDGRVISLGGKNAVVVNKGDSIQILTPGGGAYGAHPVETQKV